MPASTPLQPGLPSHFEAGGILAATLVSMTVLAMVVAVTLGRIQPRLATTYHSASWAEALNSAETGADMALAAMNNSVASPATAWAGWSPSDATTFPKTWVPSIASHGGDGNNKVYCKITVDNSIVDGSGNKWMRVRSLGVAELPPAARTGIESAVRAVDGTKSFRSILRKENFKTDQTAGVLRLPQAVRRIEAMAAPPGARLYIRALTTANEIKLISPLYVDSFDSTDATKSTGGQWVLAKRQSNADIASNSAGGISTLNNCNVWGDASCNTGAMSGTTNVHGSQFNNFTTTIPPVAKPVFSTVNVAPGAITNPAVPVTLTGGPAASPQNYKLTDLTLSNGTKPLILAPHLVGQESYVNIWVTGTTTISATGVIQQQPGVHVQFYGEGSIILGGGGWDNQTKLAKNLQVYGVTPAVYSTKDFRVTSGTFIGIFNGGSTFDLTISGTGTFIGAAIGREADYSGTGAFHYDEDLANFSASGSGNSIYQYSSWIEDIR